MTVLADRPPRLITLILLSSLSFLSLNMFLPSLPHIAKDFEADYRLVSLSIAGYLVTTAILQLIIGPISDLVGRRPVILVSLTVFVLSSMVCATATSIEIFMLFRVLQGAVISGAVLSRAIVRDNANVQETAQKLGQINMAMSIAPILGPVFGGVLDESLGWRSSFVAFSLMGSGLLALCWFDLGETNTAKSSSLSQQFRMYPELFKSVSFWAYALCSAFATATFYAFLAGIPLIAASAFGMSPILLGLSIGSTTIGFLFGSYLSGQLATKHSLSKMMLLGQMIACAGLLFGIASFALGGTHAVFMLGPAILVGVGNGLTMPHAVAGAMSVRPTLAGTASGLSGALIVFGGAIITAITANIIVAGGVIVLLTIMLACSAGGLICCLLVDRSATHSGDSSLALDE